MASRVGFHLDKNLWTLRNLGGLSDITEGNGYLLVSRASAERVRKACGKGVTKMFRWGDEKARVRIIGATKTLARKRLTICKLGVA